MSGEPRAKDAFIGVGAGCGVLLVVGGLVGLLSAVVGIAAGGEFDPETLERYAMYGLPVQHLALLAVGLLLASRFGPSREVVAWIPAKRWWLVPLVVPVGMISDYAVNTAYQLAPWLDLGGLDLLGSALLDSGPLGLFLVGLGAVVMAPIAEEVLFRGFVFRGLKQSWGVVAAVLVSTLLFALFHADPLHAVGVLVIGVWLGWLRHATGSIKTCVVAHLANNALWVAQSLWFDEVPTIPGWLALVAAVSVIVVAVGVSRQDH